MKTAHIEARIKSQIKLPDSFIENLPLKLAVFTTVQLMNSLEGIMNQLKEKGKTPLVFKTGHTRHKGQILGCNVQNYSDYASEEFDAFLYIGDGLFHPKSLIMKNKKKVVYSYNPFTNEQTKLTFEDVKRIAKKNQGAISSFLMSSNIGVIITTKPGQHFLRQALQLKEEYPDKNFYFVVDNTFNFDSLEDFSFVDVWINTACPRIGFDDSIKISKPIVNLEDVKKKNPKRAIY